MHKGSFENWRKCRRMMCTYFGKPKMQLTDKYDGWDDLCEHLAKWMKVYGENLQPKCVELFCHTLEVIPMNWYIETELHHGTSEWDILCEGFMLTFSFEDGWGDNIDEML